MTKYLIDETSLTNIGDAIRTKKGTTSVIPVTDMPDEILSISGGDKPVRNKFASFDKVLTFAHRGITTQKTYENTMTAFRECVKNGYGGVELDIRFTKDNIPIIWHDNAFYNQNGTLTYFSDNNYNDIKDYTILNTTSEKIVTLDEALDFLSKNNICVIAEIKEDYVSGKVGAQLSKLLTIIHDYGMEEHTIIASFTYNWLTLIKNNAPSMYIGWIVQDNYSTTMLNNLIALKTDTNNVMLNYRYDKTFNASIVTELLNNGVEVGVWTDMSISFIIQVINWGVKFFVSEKFNAEFIYNTALVVQPSDMVQGGIQYGSPNLIYTSTSRLSYFVDIGKFYGGNCRTYFGGYCFSKSSKTIDVNYRYCKQEVKKFYNQQQWGYISGSNATDGLGWLSFVDVKPLNYAFPNHETFAIGTLRFTDNSNITPNDVNELYIGYMPFAEDTDYPKYLAKVLPLIEED